MDLRLLGSLCRSMPGSGTPSLKVCSSKRLEQRQCHRLSRRIFPDKHANSTTTNRLFLSRRIAVGDLEPLQPHALGTWTRSIVYALTIERFKPRNVVCATYLTLSDLALCTEVSHCRVSKRDRRSGELQARRQPWHAPIAQHVD